MKDVQRLEHYRTQRDEFIFKRSRRAAATCSVCGEKASYLAINLLRGYSALLCASCKAQMERPQ